MKCDSGFSGAAGQGCSGRGPTFDLLSAPVSSAEWIFSCQDSMKPLLRDGVLPDSSSIAQHPGKCLYSDNQWEGPDPSLGSFTALADGLRSLVFTPVVFFFPPKITDSDKYKNNIYALDIIIIEHIILIYISITKYIILL